MLDAFAIPLNQPWNIICRKRNISKEACRQLSEQAMSDAVKVLRWEAQKAQENVFDDTGMSRQMGSEGQE